MREIKFRWVGRNRKFNEIQINNDLTTTKLLEGNVLSFFDNSNRGKEGNCEFLSEDLFTGLKDKNGVDIYEGDIIKWKETRFHTEEQRKNNVPMPKFYESEVVFYEGEFIVSSNQQNDTPLCCFFLEKVCITSLIIKLK